MVVSLLAAWLLRAVIVPLGASTNSIADPPELTARCLLAVNDPGVSVKPANVVVPGGVPHVPSCFRNSPALPAAGTCAPLPVAALWSYAS